MSSSPEGQKLRVPTPPCVNRTGAPGETGTGILSSSCSREGEWRGPRWGPRRPPALAASAPETQVPGAQTAAKGAAVPEGVNSMNPALPSLVRNIPQSQR